MPTEQNGDENREKVYLAFALLEPISKKINLILSHTGLLLVGAGRESLSRGGVGGQKPGTARCLETFRGRTLKHGGYVQFLNLSKLNFI